MTELPKLAFVILARKGSKRFPGKNEALFLGIPLWERAVLQALNAGILLTGVETRVIFSTDNVDWRVAAERYDIDLIDRPSQLADDYSSSWLSVIYALSMANLKSLDTHIVLLQPTSPLRTTGFVVEMCRQLISGRHNLASGSTRGGDWDGSFFGLKSFRELLKFPKSETWGEHGGITFCPPNWMQHDVNKPEFPSIDVDHEEDLERAERFIAHVKELL